MREARARDVRHFDIRLDPFPADAPRKKLSSILQDILSFYKDPAVVWWNRAKTRKIYIRDMSSAGSLFYILLYSVDSEAAGASFSHLTTDQQRDEHPQVGEGRPESAHLVIRCRDEDDNNGVWTLLAEEAGSLPRRRIEVYMRHVVSELIKSQKINWRYPDPDGSVDSKGVPRTKSYRADLRLAGHLSLELKQALESGGLTGIALETHRAEKMGFGEGRYFKPKVKQLRLSAVGSWSEEPFERIAEALRIARSNNWDEMRINFKTSDGAPHQVLLNSENGQTMNDGFVRRTRVTFSGLAMSEAEQEIHHDFCRRMVACFT